jgi:hypothetical protein
MSQVSRGTSRDRLTRSRLSAVFFDHRANAELVPKFHTVLHDSHAAFPMLTQQFRLIAVNTVLR